MYRGFANGRVSANARISEKDFRNSWNYFNHIFDSISFSCNTD